MKTWMANSDSVEPKWWIVDAEGKTLGRMATQIADILRGKNKPTFTPHVDTGDFVVVVNADKVRLTGLKTEQKMYYKRSRWFGSLKETTADEMLDKDPGYMIEKAVRGMLPKNKLSTQIIKKLKTYRGTEHPHSAQKLEALQLN